jgi:NH3-dependent NAD+ synthetase
VLGIRLPSQFTSDLSNDLAQVQARALGVELATISIGPPFSAALDVLKPAFAALSPRPSALSAAPDVTEENLQSRCRGIVLMALSNKFGRMLLSTGNKSEYAVGYATIYGDMCGGYAPLKDCYKQLVYALARWRNAQPGIGLRRQDAEANSEAGPKGERQEPLVDRESGIGSASGALEGACEVIPSAVIERAPSAELRENQTDQDSLPPYEVLDAILERFIDSEQSQAEIIAAGFDEATVRRVARLVLGSEFKRRQSAPGPKISVRAFGRDRRYPITSGWR